MVVHIDEIGEILACPRCRGALCPTADGRACSAPDCGLAGQPFPTVAGQPVLIDFADSIIDRTDLLARAGSSYKERRQSAPTRVAFRMVFGHNRIAEAAVATFTADLKCLNRPPRLLVIGGGGIGGGAEALYTDSAISVIGTDIYCSPHTTLLADGHHLPFTDGSIDGIWVQAVLEHVLDPPQVVAEIYRVLRPGGLVFADTPFMQQVHEDAYDFTRYTLSGHRWLFRRFEMLDAGCTSGAGMAALWSVRYFVRALTGSGRLGSALQIPFFWLRLLDRIARGRANADAACAVFFYGRKSDVSLSPRDMVTFYQMQQELARRRNGARGTLKGCISLLTLPISQGLKRWWCVISTTGSKLSSDYIAAEA